MTEVEAQNAVARIEHRQHYCGIGLRTRMGLHIGPFNAKKLLYAVNGQLFYLVYNLASAIIAFAR